MLIDLVELNTRDGVTLPGGFYAPEGKGRGPVNAVLLNPGTASNFYTNPLRTLAQCIASAGYAALTISSRGHDLVWRDKNNERYLGGSYERISDCRYDFEAAFDLLSERGFSSIALLGHSLGGAKAMWYAAHEPDSRVRAIINCSAPRWSSRDYRAAPEADAYLRSLATAEALVAEGKGDTLIEGEFPRPNAPSPNLVTAAGFIDKYGAETYNFEEYTDQITLPILRVEGTLETGTVQRGVADAIRRLAVNSPRYDVAVIEGGNHGYSGVEVEAGNAIARWLDTL